MTRYQAYPGRNGLSERAPSQATDDAGQFGRRCSKRLGATLSGHRVATSRREARRAEVIGPLFMARRSPDT